MEAANSGVAATTPSPAADSSSDSTQAFDFGWVPSDVVRALLEEVGNFRARAGAIELLHAAVLDAARDPAAVLRTLASFLDFLKRLVLDANFKIAISAMTILEDLVGLLGADAQPQLGALAAPLTERLGDNVQMVRQAAAHAIAALCRALGPHAVLTALGGTFTHPNWRVREEAVNAYTSALLSHPKEQFDYPTCVRALAGSAADGTPRVAAAALEAFAVVHTRLGALLQGLLTAVGVPEAVKTAVAERIRQAPALGLPSLDADGNLQHQPHARPPSAQRPKPAAAPTARSQQLTHAATLPASVGRAASMPSTAMQQLTPPSIPPGGVAAGGPSNTPWLEPRDPEGMPAGRTQSLPLPAAASAAALGPSAATAAADAGGWSWSPVFGEATAVDASGCSQTAAQAAPEFSTPSCTSSSLAGSLEADGSWAVERSGGSLLNWRRPARRTNQLSFTGAPASRAAAAGGASTGSSSRGSSSSPSSARSTVLGRAEGTEARTGDREHQQGRGGLRSFSLSRAQSATPDFGAAAAAVPAAAMAKCSTLPRQPHTGGALQPAVLLAGSSAPGEYNADLYSSVRNWQLQKQGSSASGDGGASAPDSWAEPPGQDSKLTVEPRSESLLQWRLPGRQGAGSASAQQATAGALQAGLRQQGPADPAAAAQPPSPARIGSASLKRAFKSISKKIFGTEAAASGVSDQQQQQQQQQQQREQQGSLPGQHPGTEGWSIPAARKEQQLPEQVATPVAGAAKSADPYLETGVPEAGCQLDVLDPGSGQPGTLAGGGPGTGADRLSRLKRLSERRRVWSAPLVPQPSQDVAACSEAAQEPETAAVSSPAVTAALPGDEVTPAGEATAVSGAAAGSDGSPGPRPGLQALKSRARTARTLSSAGGTLVPPPTAGGGSGGPYLQYSMEAVDAVFGPDQPVLGSRPSLASAAGSGLWGPLKTAGSRGSGNLGSGNLAALFSSGSSTPARTSGLLRGASGSSSGSMQWPDSPAGRHDSPGRSVWRTGSGALPDSPTGAWKDGPLVDGWATLNSLADTSPLAQPEAALQQALAALQAAALAQKKELDWQAQHEALRTLRRLAVHHPALVAPAATLHALVALAAPVIDALRSTLARLAIAVFQSLVEALGPAMDPELEAFVPLLLKRAGQVSISGRDNFLAAEADRVLTALVTHAGEARCAAALLSSLSSKSPDIRARAAMHLASCLQQHGGRLVGAAGAGSALTPRLLRAAVALLEEGALEARTAGKRMLFELRGLLDAAAAAGLGDDFKRCLDRLECKADKVWEVLESGRMPSMLARLPSASFRPPPGTSPSSPKAVPYSPIRPGPVAPGASTTGPAARLGPVGSGSGPGSSASNAASAQGPSARLAHAASGGVGPLLGALPASRWQPSARRGSTAAPGGSARGGIAEGDRGSMAAAAWRRGSRPGSASCFGPAPAGSLAGLEPELQQRLEGAAAQLASPEWKSRLEGLQAVQAAVGSAVGALPTAAQLWLADSLRERVGDANLRCQQQALAVLNSVLACTGTDLVPAAPALLPAICKCLDSGNPSVRQASSQALDAALATWPAHVHLPLLAGALGSPVGTARGKEALLQRLASLAPVLWAAEPLLLRQHLLPAVFALLAAGRRPELRQLAQGVLPGLASLLGGELSAAAMAAPLLAPAQQAAIAELVSAAQAGGRTE
ncbi:hypothetical protein ABPG77_007198 [Micractinium sp. CCAP 211/92]